MRLFFHWEPCLLLLLLPSTPVLGHDDGIHWIQKQAQTTRPARLHARDDGNTCGSGMKMCPSSLGGRCCPDNYDCAFESCYATTRGPSTCGTKVGWYACAAVYGGGCCPDGYLCQRAANCVPPPQSPYTYGCPSSHYLCPSSMSYGCCPHGMACAVGQCYSTAPTPTTRTLTLTSIIDGRTTEMMTTTMATVRPEAPTGFPSAANPSADEDADQSILKYYPTAVAQISPPQTVSDGSSGNRVISAAQLAGLVAGSMSLLGLVLAAIYMMLRRFMGSFSGGNSRDKVPIITEGKEASSDKFTHPPASETDGTELATSHPYCPELPSPSPGDGPLNMVTPIERVVSLTPTVSHLSRNPCFPGPGGGPSRWPSNVSEASSDARAELEAHPVPAELPASPCSTVSGWDGGWSASTAHSYRWPDGWSASRRLDVVDEETNG
ncbi:hypothetical protein XA68_14968 [Ophiocordyceps unilateralis]|uniref:Mid2 domain-containing protein n=1 Tax=Ophiocordyceps unilateralis TaxID=268505 RepID=A0A2A9PL93_OPHUN|nr:hypothetical protein XA68_14968 [Ophiocordyceps unilateralis]